MGSCVSAKPSNATALPPRQSNLTASTPTTSTPQASPESISRDDAEKQLKNLLESYASIAAYIESLRETAFKRLFLNLDRTGLDSLNISSSDVSVMESLAKDLTVFRQFKGINRYKYQLVLSEFIKSIKECLLKIKYIDSLNTDSLEQLNHYRIAYQKNLSKKFVRDITQLYDLIMRVAIYLESDQHADSSLSCNYHSLELTSINSKRLSAYQFPHTRVIHPTAASNKSIRDEDTPV